jgi:hypothetical protein
MIGYYKIVFMVFREAYKRLRLYDIQIRMRLYSYYYMRLVKHLCSQYCRTLGRRPLSQCVMHEWKYLHSENGNQV